MGRVAPALLLLLFLLALQLLQARRPAPGLATIESQLLTEAHEPAAVQWLIKHRRALHMIPELAFEEHKTSAYVRSVLDDLGVPYYYPVARTGIIAHIGPPPYHVALRADMDGLPITEALDVSFASTHPGRMHACGHDAHTSMLLGAARLLKSREGPGGPLAGGGVLLVFQPAEEGRGGAKEVVKEGVLDGVKAMFGMHVWPTSSSSGTLMTRPGAMMAASTRFSVRVVGKGGHAAIPHEAVDPVVAAAQAVVALQPIVSRETNPVDAAVVSVTRFNTGPGATNVIPGSVELQGSLRALDPATFQRLIRRVEEVINGTAAAAGCHTAEWSWSAQPYPPLINDDSLAEMVAEVGGRLEDAAREAEGSLPGGIRYQHLEEATLAAEDFAMYTAMAGIPSCFVFMGISGAPGNDSSGLHTPTFSIDEERLPLGSALHASLALEALARLADAAGSAASDEAGAALPDDGDESGDGRGHGSDDARGHEEL